MAYIDIRTRVLDAAEILFSRKGFDRVTLQVLAREAHVGPGALRHAFGSKENIIRSVIERIARRISRESLQLLDEVGPPCVSEEFNIRKILDAIFRPFSNLNAGQGAYRSTLQRLVGHAYLQITDTRLWQRYEDALAAAFPGISKNELGWRLRLVLVTGFAALSSGDTDNQGSPESVNVVGASTEEIMPHLLAFLSGGVLSPALR
jgi:AcrR family transcriptional regulator